MAASSSSAADTTTEKDITKIRFPLVVCDQSFYAAVGNSDDIENLDVSVAYCRENTTHFSKKSATKNSGIVCLQYPIILSAGESESNSDEWSPMVSVEQTPPKELTPISVSTSSERDAYARMPFVFVHPSAGGGRQKNLGVLSEMFKPKNIERFLDYYTESAGIDKTLVSLSLGGNANGTGLYENRKVVSAISALCANFMAVIDTDTDAYKSIVHSAVDSALMEHDRDVATLGMELDLIKQAAIDTFKDIVDTLVFSMVRAPRAGSKTKEYVFHVESTPIITTSPLMVLPFVCAFVGTKTFYRWGKKFSSSSMVRTILARIAEKIGDANFDQQMECISLVKCRRLSASTTNPKLRDYFDANWYPASTATTKSKTKGNQGTTNYKLFMTTLTRLLFLATGQSGPKSGDFNSASWHSVCYKKIVKKGDKAVFRSAFTYADQIELARTAIEYRDNPKYLFSVHASLCALPMHGFLTNLSVNGSAKSARAKSTKKVKVADDDKDDEVLGAIVFDSAASSSSSKGKTKSSSVDEQLDFDLDVDDQLFGGSQGILAAVIGNKSKKEDATVHSKKKKRSSSKSKRKRQRETDEIDNKVKRNKNEKSHSDIDNNELTAMLVDIKTTNAAMFADVKLTIDGMRKEIDAYTKKSEELERKAYERGVEDAYARVQASQKEEVERLLADVANTLSAVNKPGSNGAKQHVGNGAVNRDQQTVFEKPASDRKRKHRRDDDDSDDYESSSDEDLIGKPVCHRRPSTRRSKTISAEQFEENIAKLNEIAKAEASSGDEEYKDSSAISGSDEEMSDDDLSSGLDVEDSDEEDDSVEELDSSKLGHILQETLDRGKGPSEDDSIIISIEDVSAYCKNYLSVDDDEEFNPNSKRAVAVSSSSSNQKLTREKRKAMSRYLNTCIMGEDLCLSRAINDSQMPSPIHVLGRIGMIVEPSKEQLKNADELEKYIELCESILKCSDRRSLNSVLMKYFKACGVDSRGSTKVGQYRNDSEICVCTLCRSVETMPEREFIAYYRKNFLVQSVDLGKDEEDRISDSEIKDARNRMLDILRACPAPLEKGIFSAKTDWWCVKTGTFFYKSAPQNKQIALVRISPQERAINPNVRKDIIGKSLDKPVYYKIPACNDHATDDQIFCPGSLSREQFSDSLKELKRRLARMRSTTVAGTVFSGSSSELEDEYDDDDDDDDVSGVFDDSDESDDEYNSN